MGPVQTTILYNRPRLAEECIDVYSLKNSSFPKPLQHSQEAPGHAWVKLQFGNLIMRALNTCTKQVPIASKS